MSFLQHVSTHWRFTCGFKKYGIDYRDYMRAKTSALDIMKFNGYGICSQVELINIRGHVGRNVDAAFWQATLMSFHVDSHKLYCEYSAYLGSLASEDNFGYYLVQNSDFRCTESPNGTTQLWFGTYV